MLQTGLVKSMRPLKTAVQLNIKLMQSVSKKDLAKWLSKELETLGPTYIKVGQFISSRKDIFGREFTDEFADLRDSVSPLTNEEVDQIIKPLVERKVLKGIIKKPIASASIGQVHKAQLSDGKRVVLKVRRPNIEADIKANIAFFLRLIAFFQLLDAVPNLMETANILRDFESGVLKEVDFKNEANNIQLFRTIYKDNELIYVPKLYKKYSDSDIIMMEFIPSAPVTSYKGDRALLARQILQAFLQQLIQTGTIHGDPHPGNIGILSDGRIVLYDFGNVVQINYQDRQYLKELIYYLLVNNKSAIITTLKRLNIRIINERDMSSYIDGYISYMKTLDFTQIAPTNTTNVKMPFILTGEFFRLIRVFGVLEGLCKELDPNFNYFDVLQNYASDIFMDQDFIIYKTRADFGSLVPPLEQCFVVDDTHHSALNLLLKK